MNEVCGQNGKRQQIEQDYLMSTASMRPLK